jgi:hypothetical protein
MYKPYFYFSSTVIDSLGRKACCCEQQCMRWGALILFSSENSRLRLWRGRFRVETRVATRYRGEMFFISFRDWLPQTGDTRKDRLFWLLMPFQKGLFLDKRT